MHQNCYSADRASIAENDYTYNCFWDGTLSDESKMGEKNGIRHKDHSIHDGEMKTAEGIVISGDTLHTSESIEISSLLPNMIHYLCCTTTTTTQNLYGRNVPHHYAIYQETNTSGNHPLITFSLINHNRTVNLNSHSYYARKPTQGR